MAPLIPEHKTNHPLGTYRKHVDHRVVMDTIFFVLRTGCHWNALNATGIYSSPGWCDARFFARFLQNGLLACGDLNGIDWSWLPMDDSVTKSPLSGTKKQVVIPRTERNKMQVQSDDRCQRATSVAGHRCSEYARHQVGYGYVRCPSFGEYGTKIQTLSEQWLRSRLTENIYTEPPPPVEYPIQQRRVWCQ